jgi:hypothetical protein
MIREGSTVGIRKKVRVRGPGKPLGSTTDVTMPVVAYSNDGLAQLIVNAWTNTPANFKRDLLDRDPRTGLPTSLAVTTATNAVNTLAHLDLKRAVVISEAEHDDDYVMQSDDEVVFVLPDETRLRDTPPPLANRLETAKLLMACTPNGI